MVNRTRRVAGHRAWVFLTALGLAWALWAREVRAYNAQTHQDLTAYAFELMVVAEQSPEIKNAFAQEPALLAFLSKLAKVAEAIERLPSNLPAPHLDFCSDPEAAKKVISLRPKWPAPLERASMSAIPYPIDVQYVSNEKSCGVRHDWLAGVLYRNKFESEFGHAGNVLGFWAAHPDDLLNEVRLQFRPTNLAPFNALKLALEAAGGAAIGTVWVPIKCFTRCASALLELDFDDCKACVSDAVDQGSDVAHDGIATVDGLFPGFGEFKSEMLVGMCHHIDIKDQVVAPGWSPIPKRKYDDVSGLYGVSAGPFGVPGFIEKLAVGGSQLGISVNYDESDSVKNYQVEDGHDYHANTEMRDKADWEYLNWPFVPMTPLDNLAWFGWDRFRASVVEVGADSSGLLQSKYLGWVLHGLGDATVPMHVTGTFAWGHRPYEDAVEELGRALLGGDEHGNAVQHAIAVLRAAHAHRQFIDQWRADHPDRPGDVPVRDLVTRLARKTFEVSLANTAVFDDTASSLYLLPPTRGSAVEGYKALAPIMGAHLQNSVAAVIAFLSAALEASP